MDKIVADEPIEPDGPKPSLRNSWAGGCDLLVFSTAHQDNLDRHADALKKAYEAVYLPHFPLNDGHESLAGWLQSFNTPDSNVVYSISVAGDNLRDGNPDGMNIKGICVSTYYKDSSTGYLAYIAVDPNARTGGLGHALFQQHVSSMVELARTHNPERGLRGLFLDCADPKKADTHDQQYDPQKRVDKYAKWGGIVLDIPYVSPSAHPDQDLIRNLVVISFPTSPTGQYATPQATTDFLRSTWQQNGIEKPDSHSDFQKMQRSLHPSEPIVEDSKAGVFRRVASYGASRTVGGGGRHSAATYIHRHAR